MTNNAEKRQHLEQNAKKEISSLYHGSIFDIHLDTIHLKERKPFSRAIINHKGAVAILPVHNNNIILIKQYRRAIDDIVLEMPAGIIEHKEDPIITAQRELQEEIGFKAHQLTPMGGFFVSPGYCNEYVYFFIAQNLEKQPLPQDEDEAIDVYSIPEKEALNLVYENKINDAKTQIGILRYFAWKNL